MLALLSRLKTGGQVFLSIFYTGQLHIHIALSLTDSFVLLLLLLLYICEIMPYICHKIILMQTVPNSHTDH